MNAVEVIPGDCPVVLAQPHSSVFVPADFLQSLNSRGRELLDTDWHVPRLYDGLLPNATIVRACFHRYVIDANRDPDGSSLYPGQNTTELVPTSTFDGDAIWTVPPDAAEVSSVRMQFHTAYHQALESELSRIRDKHGYAILYDCHSIRSRVPRLFDGELPDLNIGTNSGLSCQQSIADVVTEVCKSHTQFSYVTNGRFKGGWTTRHHGRPAYGVHAIQMEIAQSTYLRDEEPPFTYDEARAKPLRELLRQVLFKLSNLADTRI